MDLSGFNILENDKYISQNVNCDYRSSSRVTRIVLGEAMLSAVTLILTFLALSTIWKVPFLCF